MSYTFKFYSIDNPESCQFNNYCLCTLDNRDRCLVTFTLTAPNPGKYYLKIFALPEDELHEEEGGLFNFLGTFMINFTKSLHNVKPWPLSSQPFGLTSAYSDLGVTMVVKDPSVWEDDRIVLMGGTKAVFKFVHNEGPVISALHMYDHMVSIHRVVRNSHSWCHCRETKWCKKLTNPEYRPCSSCQRNIR